MEGSYTRQLLNAQRWQRCFDRDRERQEMRNHPANKVQKRGIRGAIRAAVAGEEILERPDVYSLGLRENRSPARGHTPARHYTLDAYAFRPDPGDASAPARFYILAERVAWWRCVLNSDGDRVDSGVGVDFSVPIQNWIAAALAADAALCGF